MSAHSNAKIPSYRLHKATGLAVVRLGGRDYYLGRHGTPESHAEYQRLIAEWLATPSRQSSLRSTHDRATDRAGLTLNELLVCYWKFVEQYYVKNGEPTGEQEAIRQSFRPLAELYGHTLVSDFGPASLKTVRQVMIDTDLCRNVINARIKRIRRIFKWGVENELVDPTILHGLQAVAPLKRGRCQVRESAPVKPVPEAHVDAALPHMPEPVAAMVRLQLLTGMRPGEVTLMRTADLDTTGDVWVYRPESHKTEHHGREREIYLGPKAQEVLRPWLKTELDAYLFSPAEAEQRRREQRHAERRTPLSCGNKPGTSRRPRRHKEPNERYTTQSYGRAIDAACDKAFPPPSELARRRVPGRGRKRKTTRWETSAEWKDRLGDKNWVKLQAWQRDHRWSPNQLRHSAATYLRKRFGLDAARVILGHSTPAITEVYAELDRAQAIKVMGEVG